MSIVFIPLFILSGSFLLLRKMFLKPVEQQPSRLSLFVIGVVTWVFILSSAVWVLLPLYLIYTLLAMKSLGALFPLMFLFMATGFIFVTKETLDSATVLHFLRESAFFRPVRRHSIHIQEELDKKQIRDVHRETSDKPFPTAGKQKRLLTEKEIHQHRQEMIAASERPTRSRRYDEEVASLKSGAATSIADAWKVYTFDHKSHDYYPEISLMLIDPNTRALQFNLNIPQATEKALQDPIFVYQLKQELYHLLSVLHTDPWLAWYSEFFDRIHTVCFGIEADSFGHTQLYPFMEIDIASSELHQREGKFFNAADLHKICTLTFNNGKPLSGESL
ncbi:MAG: hypothetical protein NTU47_01090 [Ignavibacteriales bacterium]|nr:hypothetical protein [Ignavibacteriales bacterium]